jgi:hypothetical protein
MPSDSNTPPSTTTAQRVGNSSTCVLITGVYEEWIGAYQNGTIVRDLRKNKRGQHFIALWNPTFDRILEANPRATPMELKQLMLAEIAREKMEREAARQARRQEKAQRAAQRQQAQAAGQ